jgi:hypothetical protein
MKLYLEHKEIDMSKESEVRVHRFPREMLAKSKQLKEFHLHYDIIRAILEEPEYTIEEAKSAIQEYLNSFNSKED